MKMDGKNEALVVVKAYEMVKFVLPTVTAFPKAHKFTFGDRLQNHLLDLLENLVEASYLSKPEKKPKLRDINLRIEKIRYLLRLGFELNLYSAGKYRELSIKLDEIGRMVGGWLRSL